MNSPPSAATKKHIITALTALAKEIEDTVSLDFAPSVEKAALLYEIAHAIFWIRGQDTESILFPEEEVDTEEFTV